MGNYDESRIWLQPISEKATLELKQIQELYEATHYSDRSDELNFNDYYKHTKMPENY